MSPVTHLLASWLIAAKTTDNPRDCRLVTLAGVLPDADGAGLAVDLTSKYFLGHETTLFTDYHHWLLHGLFGSLLITAILTCFSRSRWRVALLAFLVFHLHLLCDVAGSASGPNPGDLWPLYYLGPFSRQATLLWSGQWPLDSWINQLLTVILLGWALIMAAKRTDSFVGVFNRRADAVFIRVLGKWRAAWLLRRCGNAVPTRRQ